MEHPSLLEFVIGGFYSALSRFKSEFFTQQEQRDVVFSNKLDQILQNQQISGDDTAKIVESLTTIVSTNAQQAQKIIEQGNQIKDLLSKVDARETTLAQAETVVDSIIQKQQEELDAQTNLITEISNQLTPPSTTPETPENPTEETPAPEVPTDSSPAPEIPADPASGEVPTGATPQAPLDPTTGEVQTEKLPGVSGV